MSIPIRKSSFPGNRAFVTITTWCDHAAKLLVSAINASVDDVDPHPSGVDLRGNGVQGQRALVHAVQSPRRSSGGLRRVHGLVLLRHHHAGIRGQSPHGHGRGRLRRDPNGAAVQNLVVHAEDLAADHRGHLLAVAGQGGDALVLVLFQLDDHGLALGLAFSFATSSAATISSAPASWVWLALALSLAASPALFAGFGSASCGAADSGHGGRRHTQESGDLEGCSELHGFDDVDVAEI